MSNPHHYFGNTHYYFGHVYVSLRYKGHIVHWFVKDAINDKVIFRGVAHKAEAYEKIFRQIARAYAEDGNEHN